MTPMIDWKALEQAPRLLLEVALRPVQGTRFQPTGFPDLGAAEYEAYENGGAVRMLLVESAQSMANRMESACWDEARGTPVVALDGLPYVQVDITGGGATLTTASTLEAHRLNSPYVLQGTLGKDTFGDLFEREAGYREGQPVDRVKFVRSVLKYDPAALLHGVFMSNVGDGRMRLARAVSAFIEARGVGVAQSGGVKNDRVNASGETAKGFGNVPFARSEYTAASITAFFNLDLRQVRGYGLPGAATRLLTALALYKFARLAHEGMRLRTACDLETVKDGVRVTAPEGFALAGLSEIEAELKGALAACKAEGLFAEPAVTRLTFTQTGASAKESKRASKRDKGEGAT